MIYAPTIVAIRRLPLIALLFFSLTGGSGGQEIRDTDDSKLITLNADQLQAVILVGPDKSNPNSRFDRTGRVVSLKLDGKEFLGVGGMPDDFGMMGAGALGYGEAADGEPFLKMGVGLLRREGGAFYRFKKNYKLQEAAPITVIAQTKASVEVVQKGAALRGYEFEYRKKYTLRSGGILEIQYTVKNLGSREFDFEQFNHNWLAMGRSNPGKGMLIDWGRSQKETAASWLKAEGSTLRLLGATTDEPGYTFYMPSAEQERPADIRISDEQTGLEIHLETSFAPTREVLYIDAAGICPEICYYHALRPGESSTWSRTYTMSLNEPSRQNGAEVK